MKKRKIQWHPAFAAALRIELEEELDKIVIEEEHLLSHKPMQIDVLIVKKLRDEVMKKNIARIFKTHNIIEYKSPEDYLSLNDFYKVVGYACFYQADTEKVREIEPEEITITFACNTYPREMIKYLQDYTNMRMEKQEDGIYYLYGGLFPIQIVITGRLSKETNYWLQNLRTDLKAGGEIEKLIQNYESKKDSIWYEAVMEVIARANWKKMKEEKQMCEALRELFAEELEASRKDGMKAGHISKLQEQVTKKLAKGKCIEEIAEALEEEVPTIAAIVESMQR